MTSGPEPIFDIVKHFPGGGWATYVLSPSPEGVTIYGNNDRGRTWEEVTTLEDEAVEVEAVFQCMANGLYCLADPRCATYVSKRHSRCAWCSDGAWRDRVAAYRLRASEGNLTADGGRW